MKKTQSLSAEEKPKPEKFNFERMKIAATSENPKVRKRMFVEYFERFSEFPSYLFDNTEGIDGRLLHTIHDMQTDPLLTKELQGGVALLLQRLMQA